MKRLIFPSANRSAGAASPPPSSPPPGRRADSVLARLEPVAHSLATSMSVARLIERARRARQGGGGAGHPPGTRAPVLARRRPPGVAAPVERRVEQGLSLSGTIGIYKPRIAE
jgi:hypothetical protein